MGGWAIIVADVIVMANLAQIAVLYTFLLFGVSHPSLVVVTAIGVVWISVMTVICVFGIEVNACTLRWLLTSELVMLPVFAFGGVDRLAGDNSGDALGLLANSVFGSDILGKVVIIAVLTSAAASTQTTILPTSRTALSMARAKALPESLGRVHHRYLTPDV